MKIGVWSDLHLEFDINASRQGILSAERHVPSEFYLNPPKPDVDVLVLAGDTHTGVLGLEWAARNFAIPIVLIAGNRESYGHELFRVIANSREKANVMNGRVIFLERATWTYRSVKGLQARFIGATLWTDFNLYGTPFASMEIARQCVQDFSAINIERGYKLRMLQPSDVVRLHTASIKFLRKELQQPFSGVTVVVTHHSPSPRSISPEFQGDPLNPAFVSDLEELIYTYRPTLWIHGHVHESFDYVIGGTRIICNPRSYFPDQLNPNFDPNLAVDLNQESAHNNII